MKRTLALILGLAAVIAIVATASSSGGDGSSADGVYRVRAIFDNAVAAVPGEDVKAAGARIGSIESLDVTKDRKAVIVLKIKNAAFAPFHTDAQCTLRPEGLLAVKFVECDPGTASAPVLPTDKDGTHYLAVTHTSSPVDIDLLNNIMRNPTGQEFSILLSELGTGLAGRGRELNAVIHRANPALGQTDKVLRILAQQSGALKTFADNADQLLVPLAKDRQAIAGFIKNAHTAAGASADRSQELAQSIRKLPTFLSSLRAQMVSVQELTDHGIPFLNSLRPAAPALSRATEAIAPFARAATPAVQALGSASSRLDPLLQRTLPLIHRFRQVADSAQPVASNLDQLFKSFQGQLGFPHIMDILYGAANAVSGFDKVGHYARAEPLSGACSEYTASGFFGCDAQWGPTASSAKPTTTDGSPVVQVPGRSATRTKPDAATGRSAANQFLNYLLGQ